MTPTTETIASLPATTRYFRAFTALARVLRDPTRTDDVLVFFANMDASATMERLDSFLAHPDGRRMYAEKRAIDSRLDIDQLAALPADTLGRAYAHFLRDRGLTPDVFDGPPPGVDDDRASYFIQRMRQTHDLWHVVTGYDTDPSSEVALQAFSYGQLKGPASLILAVLGTARQFRQHPTLARDTLAGYRAGVRAAQLATFTWEDHWATPLDDVRELLGIEAPLTLEHAPARSAA